MGEKDVEIAYEKALSMFDGTNFDRLDARTQVLVTISGLEAEVNNGGFDQYYFNSGGDLAFFAPLALRRIGAERMALIAERANSVFGPAGPARERFTRQAQLDVVAPAEADSPWDQHTQEFQEYPDNIYSLVTTFVRSSD